MTIALFVLATACGVAVAQRGDEIGEMARALTVFRDNVLDNAKLRESQQQEEIKAAQMRQKAVRDMADTVERETGKSVEAAAKISREVESAASGLSTLARDPSSEASVVASASEQALASAQTVSVAAGELSTSIGAISVQVSRAGAVDTRTTEVRNAITGVSSGLSSLNSVLVRVVRSATEDVGLRQRAVPSAARILRQASGVSE
jgi:hypothetical protein